MTGPRGHVLVYAIKTDRERLWRGDAFLRRILPRQVRRTGLLVWQPIHLSYQELLFLCQLARVIVVDPAPAREVGATTLLASRGVTGEIDSFIDRDRSADRD